MPTAIVRKTTKKRVQSYEKPRGLARPRLKPNGIGVVALTAVNGRGSKDASGRWKPSSPDQRSWVKDEAFSLMKKERMPAPQAWAAAYSLGAKRFGAAGKTSSGAPAGKATKGTPMRKSPKRKRASGRSAQAAAKPAKKRGTRRKLQVFKVSRVGKKSGKRRYVGRRASGATSVMVKGRGKVAVKSGRKTRTKSFRQFVAVKPGGKGRVHVFMRNAAGSADDYAFTSVGAETNKASLAKVRASRKAARTKAKAARAKRVPQYKTVTVRQKRKVRVAYGKYRRAPGTKGLTYSFRGKGGKLHHIPLWALVGAKSQADYEASGSKYAKKLEGIVKKRRAAASALEKQAKRVLAEGSMYVPNRRKRRRAKAGKRRKARKMTVVAFKTVARRRRRRKAAPKRKRSSGKRRAGKGVSARRRSSSKRRSSAKRRTARKAATMRPNRRRSRRRSYRKNGRGVFARARRRRMKRNDFLASLSPALKTGGFVLAGFLAHKALSVVVSESVLANVGALADSPWRGTIAGALVALVGVPAAAKLLPARALAVGGGMVASLLQNALMSALSSVGQTGTAKYLAGVGDIPAMNTRGYGSYELSGFGAYPVQAMAGPSYPVQAMAGPYAQAAAGVGSYELSGLGAAPYAQAAAGYGDFELADDGMVADGIRPNSVSAEAALNAADQGSLPETDINVPHTRTAALSGGIFGGGSI